MSACAARLDFVSVQTAAGQKIADAIYILDSCVSSGHRFSREIVIQNQGRHPVHLTWSNQTHFAAKTKQAKDSKDLSLKAKVVCSTLNTKTLKETTHGCRVPVSFALMFTILCASISSSRNVRLLAASMMI